MYFMLAGVIGRFHLIKYGLAFVLTFVGLKMVWLNDAFDGKFPITWSLGIIVASIVISVVLSFLFPRPDAEEIGLAVRAAGPAVAIVGAERAENGRIPEDAVTRAATLEDVFVLLTGEEAE